MTTSNTEASSSTESQHAVGSQVDRGVRPLAERLQACIDDPMWADHAEVPKTLLRQTVEELALLRAAIGVAYGYLWCVNNEPGTPHQYPPEKAAFEARKALRDHLTQAERGRFINAAIARVRPLTDHDRALTGAKMNAPAGTDC
jgi:hypothetical protein